MIKQKCPICNSIHKKKIWHSKVWGGNKNDKFLQCKICDIVFLSPFPAKKNIEKFYSNNFGTYMKKRSKDMNWSNLKKQYQNLYKREIPLRSIYLKKYLKKGNVCDVGCSTGFTLDYISKNKKYKTFGIEPSEEHRIHIKKRHTVYPSIKNADIMFDNIIHYYVLEHVFNPFVFLNDLLSKLKKNGRMIFEIPHRNDALFSLYNMKSYKNFIMQKMHLFYFSEKSIRFILNKLKVKYEIFKCQRYNLDNHYRWIFSNDKENNFQIFSKKLNNLYMKEVCKKNYNDHFTIILSKI